MKKIDKILKKLSDLYEFNRKIKNYELKNTHEQPGEYMPISKEKKIKILRPLLLARRFEESLTELCKEEGKIPGMMILCTGQEAVGAGPRPFKRRTYADRVQNLSLARTRRE